MALSAYLKREFYTELPFQECGEQDENAKHDSEQSAKWR